MNEEEKARTAKAVKAVRDDFLYHKDVILVECLIAFTRYTEYRRLGLGLLESVLLATKKIEV